MHMKTIALVAAACPVLAAADEIATYELVWDAFWSAETHPGAYPGNGHFAPIHGTAHNADAEFWAPGAIATDGIELMAEMGKGDGLELEFGAAVDAGDALGYFKFAGTTADEMPIVKTYEITVTGEFSRLTMVSMLAPSPDWYIGINGLDLRPGGEWLETVEINTGVWDSGTDAGANFGSQDEDITPHIPISSMNGVFPFFDLGPISSWTFNLVSVEVNCEADCNADGVHNVLDFVCFQSAWQAQSETGDCNADGVYDILDFVCFQSLFTGACK